MSVSKTRLRTIHTYCPLMMKGLRESNDPVTATRSVPPFGASGFT